MPIELFVKGVYIVFKNVFQPGTNKPPQGESLPTWKVYTGSVQWQHNRVSKGYGFDAQLCQLDVVFVVSLSKKLYSHYSSLHRWGPGVNWRSIPPQL